MGNWKWSPRSLREQHIVVATMLACGHSMRETANAISLTEAHIATLARSPLFIAEVTRVRQLLQSRLLDNAVNSLQAEANASVAVLIEIRDNPELSATVRLRAADSILDRVAKTSKTHRLVDDTPTAPQFTDEQIELMIRTLNDDPIAQRAFEQASQELSALDLIDIEYSSVASSEAGELASQGEVN